MRVEVCLEGCVDLSGCEGEEGSAGDGACVVDEDCAGAELEERVLVVVEFDVGGYRFWYSLRTSCSIDCLAFCTSSMLETSHL